MKAVLFSCTAPSLRWESEERLVWRVQNNKAMVRRQWGRECPEPPLWPPAGPLNSRQLGEFPLCLKSSTCAHAKSDLEESSKGDVKKLGCCFTCQYRRTNQLINTQKVQCQLNAGNLMSGLPLTHAVLWGLKVILLLIKSRVTLTRNGIKLLSPLHITEWLST